MNSFRRQLSAVALALFLLPVPLLIVAAGCRATLEPGGGYHPYVLTTNLVNGSVTTNLASADLPLLVADSGFQLAYSTAVAAGNFEMNNEAILWKLDPNIKHKMDAIRPKVVEYWRKYLTEVRPAYVANPFPAQLKSLQDAVKAMQSLAETATAALPR